MRWEFNEDRSYAYLHLVEPATVEVRVPVEAEFPEEGWGVTLDFDHSETLVGVEFSDAQRRLPARVLAPGSAPHVEGTSLDARPAYLYLTSIGKGGVAETLTFGDAATRPAWGINLDLDRAGKIVGIEFE